MKKALLGIFFLSSFAVIACGKGDKAGTASLTNAAVPKGGSCNEAKAGVCTEYSDNPLGLAEGACTSMFKGTYAKSACPQDNVLGFCLRKDDKQYYYFGNGVAAWVDDAKEDCEKGLSPGKFTASPNADQTAKDKALSGQITASCVHKDTSCDDSTGRLADLDKQLCEDPNFGGTWHDGQPCASADLVGSCVKHGHISRHYLSETKSGLVSAKGLQTDCEDSFTKGHWYPGPAAAQAAAPNKAAKGGTKAKKK
ncbi:MAG TPA: hypothetical protein VIF62_00995 [Labilithrix sp.]